MTWIDETCFYNPFEHVWFKSAFDLENLALIKVVHIYMCVIEGMNA
jgi:hypothetical protein